MNKLRLLKIDSRLHSQAPASLPNNLSWLHWHGYPSKSLPPSFKGTKLVELCMHRSNIIELWKGKKILDKLISVDLSRSKKLRLTPDFTGLPNLKKLILDECTSLVEVHESIAFLQKLILLNLKNCRNLRRLPTSIQLESLNTLILSGCLKLEKFPEILNNMECLSKLYLDGTAIKELPSSIEHLTNLALMNLKDCRNLTSLPDTICRLRRLTNLDLSGCLKLDKLPENFGDMEYLEELYAGETAIKQLPSSFVLLRNLKVLSFHGYKRMESKSLSLLFSSCLLQREPQDSLSLMLHSVWGLHWLRKLDISGCNLFAWEFPSDLGGLSSLEELNVSGNNFVNLPASINQLSQLRTLWLVGCNKLEALMQVPTSIVDLYVDDCTSLTASNLSTEYESLKRVSFTGCSKLLEYHQSDSLADLLLKHMLHLLKLNKKGNHWLDNDFSVLLPGSDIPDWFTHQNVGYSTSVELPPNWYNDKLMGIAMSVVFETLSDEYTCWSLGYLQKLPGIPVRFKFESHDNRKYDFSISLYWRGTERKINSDHVCIGYAHRMPLRTPHIWRQLEICFQDDENAGLFEKQFRGMVAKKVRIRLVYEEEDEKMINEAMLNRYSSQPADLRLLEAGFVG